MTRHNPTLLLRHLIILKGGREVYSQPFGPGVNIIRGENGSGKSTVADFIFHVLGGEGINWRAEALSCDYAVAELDINGRPLTLQREISRDSRRPMSIFWGSMEEARGQGLTGWEIYPFNATDRKESFSQLLFRLLGFPDVFRDDLQARVTMHQVLRLLYVDQRTPFDRIFVDDVWDQKLTRA